MNHSDLSFSPSMRSNKLSTLFLYYILSPLLCAFSGFHVTNYLLLGLYTWPRTSRVLVLIIGTLIFVYEFIFKGQVPQFTSDKRWSQSQWVLYISVIPFVCGVALMMVAKFSS